MEVEHPSKEVKSPLPVTTSYKIHSHLTVQSFY